MKLITLFRITTTHNGTTFQLLIEEKTFKTLPQSISKLMIGNFATFAPLETSMMNLEIISLRLEDVFMAISSKSECSKIGGQTFIM